MKNKHIIILCFFLILTCISCLKIEELPDEPSITYLSFDTYQAYDLLGNLKTFGTLKFSFVDGDGNIGRLLTQQDIADSVSYDVELTLFNKIDTLFVESEEKDYYLIPALDRKGVNKTLKGEIELLIPFDFIDYDTIKYEFFLIDKSLNKSNVEETPEIIFSEQK